MKFRHRVLVVATVGVAALGMSGLTAGVASATQYSGCVWDALCDYYSPNLAGSSTSWNLAVSTYGSANFLSSGAGQGQNVANNAASAWNTDVDYHARVYTSTSYSGSSQVMNVLYSATDSINFNTALRNNNDSQRFTLS